MPRTAKAERGRFVVNQINLNLSLLRFSSFLNIVASNDAKKTAAAYRRPIPHSPALHIHLTLYERFYLLTYLWQAESAMTTNSCILTALKQNYIANIRAHFITFQAQ